MTSSKPLTADEIAQRITIGMRLVYDLFTEMHGFFRLVADGLREAGVARHFVGGMSFGLPRSKKGIAERFVRTDMGLSAEVCAVGEDHEDDDEEDEVDKDDESDDNDEETGRGRLTINPDSKYLALRAILFDPSRKIHPLVVGCKLTSITLQGLGRKAKQEPQRTFQVKKIALKRLTKQLEPGLKVNEKIACRIPGGELSARIASIEEWPLATIDSEDDVSKIVDRLVQMADET